MVWLIFLKQKKQGVPFPSPSQWSLDTPSWKRTRAPDDAEANKTAAAARRDENYKKKQHAIRKRARKDGEEVPEKKPRATKSEARLALGRNTMLTKSDIRKLFFERDILLDKLARRSDEVRGLRAALAAQ